jgi:hypothetical protein
MNLGTPLLAYSKEQLTEYEKELAIIASLSNLYSDSKAPMIYYRATENIYCRAFGAQNISRSDCTADAIFNLTTGVGIKTFLGRPQGSYQKIAEFNKQEPLYRDLTGIDLVKKIASLRNDRIDFTIRNYGLKSMIYHCILRYENQEIRVYEEPMHRIDIDAIRITENNNSNCRFTDGIEQYEFYYPKSTLFKFFKPIPPFLVFKAPIVDDPMEYLSKFSDAMPSGKMNQFSPYPYMVVPLYSENSKRGRFVAEKSGLNQWNAGGRSRDPNEVYIRFPKWLRDEYPGFFPPRGEPWMMTLPNHDCLKMAVCQDTGKALMSNPNKALGKWILRDVLDIPEGHVVTYEDLCAVGINSIKIIKQGPRSFACDFIENDADED